MVSIHCFLKIAITVNPKENINFKCLYSAVSASLAQKSEKCLDTCWGGKHCSLSIHLSFVGLPTGLVSIPEDETASYIMFNLSLKTYNTLVYFNPFIVWELSQSFLVCPNYVLDDKEQGFSSPTCQQVFVLLPLWRCDACHGILHAEYLMTWIHYTGSISLPLCSAAFRLNEGSPEGQN